CEVLDRAFLEEKTHGFDVFARALRAVSWDELVEQSGVARDLMREAARIYIESNRTIVCWAMGLTQHKNAVANIQEIVNLLLLRGRRKRSFGYARHGVHGRGASPLSSDRARLDEDEPRAPRHGRAGFNPPLPRSHRARRAKIGRAVRQRRELYGRGSLFARRA